MTDLHCFVENSFTVEPYTDSGPLSGVSFAIKDLFSLVGHTSSFGHAKWRQTHEPATSNARAVEMTLQAGGRIVGLTKMDQLAYSLIGNIGEGISPVNSYRSDCYCGGSSSGSASAVAGGLADLGLGTDTAGSIRIPAASCGIFGLRFSHGAADLAGVIPLAPSMDALGLLSREPQTMLKGAEVLLANQPRRSFTAKRILIASDCMTERSDYRDRVRSFAKEISSVTDNAVVSEVDVAAFTGSDVTDLFTRLQSREIWTQHSRWVEENKLFLASDVQLRLERCKLLSSDSGEFQATDKELRENLERSVKCLLGDDAILLIPAGPGGAPELSWDDASLAEFRRNCIRLTALSSLSGLPQLVFGQASARESDSDQIPMSVIGPYGSDRSLINLAVRMSNL